MAVTLDSLKKAVKKNKGRSQALAWLADMLRASGEYDNALKLIDEALAASPSDVPAMLVRAKILAGMQDFAGSIMEYKKVLSKDPFCLSAHKRMGESYDKLGKVAERNACFRRVHDMDPLDPFWKDEYDVLPEEQQDDLVAPPMDDSSFTMDVEAESENNESNGEDDVFANLAASLPNTDEEDNSAMDALRNSLDSASDENTSNFDAAQDAGFDGHALNSSEVSSAIADILGGDDDLETSDASSEKATNPSPFSHMEFSDDEVSKSDDIDFSLDDTPADDGILSLDEPATEEKATNVNDAFSSIFGDDELPEEKPAEPSEEVAEEPVEKTEEPQAEESSESLGGLFEKSADADFSLDVASDDKSEVADLEEKEDVAEEKATNVDDAFSSIFGDDELPEEKPAEPSEEVAEEPVEKTEEPQAEERSESLGGLFEKSADADFSLNDAPSDVILKEPDSQFAEEKSEEPAAEAESVAEEKPAEEPSELAAGSIPTTHMDFSDEEDSSSNDVVFDLDEPPADAPVEDTPAETAPVDEAPAEEKPVDEKPDVADIDLTLDEEPAEEKPAESAPVEEAPAEDLTLAEETPAEEKTAEDVSLELSDVDLGNGTVPGDHMDFSDEEVMPEEHDPEFKVDNTPLTLDETLAEEKPVEEAPVEDVPAEDLTLDDETPAEEKPAEDLTLADESPAEEPVAEEKTVETAPVEEKPTEEVAEKPGISEDLSVSVDGAFDALFGDDEDDAPAEEEKAEEKPLDTDEFSLNNDTLELPEEKPAEDNLAKEMGGAFASMFGDDDDLALPEEKSEEPVAEALAEEPLSQEATSAEIEESSVKDSEFKIESASDFVANESDSLFEKSADADFTLNDSSDEPAEMATEPAAEQSAAETALEQPAAETAEVPSAELDSIGSEVSNAFKGLFDEDDSLPESDEPSNKGVDYLMSGDSDDEVSASLVNDADAPLSRGAADLDDSLNTRTLADIYMEQGVYNKALEIYSDLAKKNPDNAEIKSRLEEVQKLCREKFGEN